MRKGYREALQRVLIGPDAGPKYPKDTRVESMHTKREYSLNRGKFIIISWINHKARISILPVFISAFIACFMWGTPVESKERITLGFVEEVILLPSGVKLPARIDTGAAQSSLDARDMVVKGKIVEFKLPEKYGGLQLRLPIIAWKTVRSAEARERRPVVMMEICLGGKRIRTRVNLNDRSQVKYPFLVGRSALRKNFVVDCMKEMCAPSICPEVQTN